ncbi:MAG: hypothetical protein M1470_11790 [Bacteroidetes bacterium]|nr:hypothetical protein [Bacteroidota bacterium]
MFSIVLRTSPLIHGLLAKIVLGSAAGHHVMLAVPCVRLQSCLKLWH